MSDGVATPEFDATGAQSYGLTLMPGKYVVTYEPNWWLCSDPDDPPEVPCEEQRVAGCD